jgi:hypothetical protein
MNFQKIIKYEAIDFLDLKLNTKLISPILLWLVENSPHKTLDEIFDIHLTMEYEWVKSYMLYSIHHPKIPLCNIHSIKWIDKNSKNGTRIKFYWEFFSLYWLEFIDHILMLLNHQNQLYDIFRLDYCIDLIWYLVREHFFIPLIKSWLISDEESIHPKYRGNWYMNYFRVDFTESKFRAYDKKLDISDKWKDKYDLRYKEYLKEKKSITRFEIVSLRRQLKRKTFDL